jgi:predicted lipoprotein with Yx(FWY)xxD motif
MKGTKMTRTKSASLLGSLALAPLIALAAAGCSSSGASPSAAPPGTAGGTPATVAAATVAVANSGLGQVLVNAQGRTLYLFQKDSGTTSACSGACATAWPPLLVSGQPTAGSGANAALLGTSQRSDGGTQVTYNGHPVYLFTQDQKPGDTNGQGVNAFGASWFALTPAGNQVAAAAPSGTSSPGGY